MTGTPQKTAAAGPEPSRCHETPLRRLANNEKLTARPQYEARARAIYIFDFFLAFFFFAMVLNPYGGC
jgi:hypothetical protein